MMTSEVQQLALLATEIKNMCYAINDDSDIDNEFIESMQETIDDLTTQLEEIKQEREVEA